MHDATVGRDAFDPSKEIRLHLPLQTHLLLHELKIRRNQSIRDAVVAALELYFKAHPVEAGANPGA
ncbi:MAG: hypothetical protein HYT80_00800 [Euryarchaeota archaeon]|nr:hypothetical protein [Euryarchaeota archaeon]